jgi:hypothetical protein
VELPEDAGIGADPALRELGVGREALDAGDPPISLAAVSGPQPRSASSPGA